MNFQIWKFSWNKKLEQQAMKEVDFEHLENHIHILKEEEKKRKRMITLSYHNYYYVDNRENAAYYPSSTQRSLPYPPSAYPDLSSEYRNKQESKENEKIRKVYEGDIAD